jgi:hypothetical protein
VHNPKIFCIEQLLIFSCFDCVLCYFSESFYLRVFGGIFLVFKYRIISSSNRNNLTLSFPIYILLTCFFCFIPLAKVLSTTLNKSGNGRYSCIVPDFRGNAFTCSSFSIMLAVGLSYIGFSVLSYIPCVPSFQGF